MSVLSVTPEATAGIIEHRIVEQRTYKTPIAMSIAVFALALIYLLMPRHGIAQFQLAQSRDTFQIPMAQVPGMPFAWITLALATILVAIAFWLAYRFQKLPLWAIGIFALLALAGFLAWAAAGSIGFINVVGLLSGSIMVAIPLIFGALGGVIGERSGVVNIAIEAQLLMAAFTGAVTGSITGNAWVGLLAAMVAGLAVAALLGVFAIKYKVDQVIVGVVLNVLVAGITTFLWRAWLQTDSTALNRTDMIRFQSIRIPGLSSIPIIGPALFDQNIIVYLMYLAVAGVWFGLYRTKWGLRTRAVGEHPKAADTVGIKVQRTRWIAVLLAGAIVGIGGASYTLVTNSSFEREMTAGFGFIALAAVIFGNWNPVRASFAGLLFGFAINLRVALQAVGSPVPSQFMLMVPYVVTLIAVAGLVGRSRAPAAVGSAY
jgi:simple sugar transport system permease protein